jgi:hypothetical protein
VTEGRIIAFHPEIDRNPVVQNPRSTTSPLPKEGNIPKITANKYINNIPITKVGSETPRRETAKITSLAKLFLFIPV